MSEAAVEDARNLQIVLWEEVAVQPEAEAVALPLPPPPGYGPHAQARSLS